MSKPISPPIQNHIEDICLVSETVKSDLHVTCFNHHLKKTNIMNIPHSGRCTFLMEIVKQSCFHLKII